MNQIKKEAKLIDNASVMKGSVRNSAELSQNFSIQALKSTGHGYLFS